MRLLAPFLGRQLLTPATTTLLSSFPPSPYPYFCAAQSYRSPSEENYALTHICYVHLPSYRCDFNIRTYSIMTEKLLSKADYLLFKATQMHSLLNKTCFHVSKTQEKKIYIRMAPMCFFSDKNIHTCMENILDNF